jgi:hypothetical protein
MGTMITVSTINDIKHERKDTNKDIQHRHCGIRMKVRGVSINLILFCSSIVLRLSTSSTSFRS